MQYQIGRFRLDAKARQLSDENGSQNIRPKTLALLLYLAQRPEQVISKQTLLDIIWDDVKVDEGVIFQSVREIRTLFDDPNIIQNFPRKGYQFCAELVPISTQSSKPNRYFVLAVSLVLLITAWVLWTSVQEEEITQQSILVLPIKNYVPYGENDWLAIGGMEQLINQIGASGKAPYIYQTANILELMEQVGLFNELGGQGAQSVLNRSGASVVVETELHGNVYDYKLVYRLHTSAGVYQGVILDTSIPSALKKLSTLVANWPEARDNQSEFSQTLLSEAMISYEKDWQTSISFFESYLTLNPESSVAMIYLTKLYLWQQKIEQAEQLISKAANLSSSTEQELAQISLLQARIAVKKKRWQPAFELFNKAQSYHQGHQDWFLKANIEEEKGLAYAQLCQWQEASAAFSLAHTYYQLINSPIGINSSLLHTSYVQFQQGKDELAELTKQTAIKNIEQVGLEFLNTMLDKYQKANTKVQPCHTLAQP